MRKATENQGNNRALAANFSPRSKVKDLALQERSLPQFTSFHQETPMKPSQVPNRLSQPPPRRALPIQTPELCYRDKPGPHQHPPHISGSVHSSVFSPSSPSNFGPSVNKSHPLSKHRLGPLKHCAQHPSSTANVGTAVNRNPPMPRDMLGHPQHFAPPGVLYPVSPELVKNLSNYSPSLHSRKDQVTESTVTSWNSGGKTVTAQRQETYKAESFGVGTSIQTVQLHRPPMSLMTTPFNNTAAQEVHPQPPSYSEYWSPHMNQWPLLAYQPPPYAQFCDTSSGYTLPIMHSSVAPCQSQQHEPTPPKLIPVVELNRSRFQKRHRQFESCLEDAKKLCHQGSNGGKTQTAKPTVVNSPVTSPVSLLSLNHSPAMEPSPITTERHLHTEPACRPPSTGAKQAHVYSTHNHTVILKELRSPSQPGEESAKKQKDENCKRDKSRTFFSSEVSQSDTSTSALPQLSSHYSGHSAGSTSVPPVETINRDRVGESRKLDSSTPKPALKSNSSSQSCRTVERKKTARARKTVVVPDDADKLFTPDPMIYIVNPAHKTAKPNIDGGTINSSSSEKDCLSSAASNSPATGSSCHKTPNSKAPGSSHAASSSACNPPIYLPTITLKRVNLENVKPLCPEDKELKYSPIASAGAQFKDKTVKSDDKHTSPLSNNLSSCTLETATAQTSKSSSPKSEPLERQASEGSRKQENEEDPIDLDLDLDLSFALDVDLTQSSHSSEEEQLISLQEMMERVTKLPDTPQKGAFSEPSTPGHCSSQPKTQLLRSTTKTGCYKNNLDQMLKDINTTQKAKEIETQRITACKEDLLRIAEYEEGAEAQEEGISTEQQKFLQHFTLMSSAIKEVAPGETVFNLDKFGQIFNQETLQLRECRVIPQGTAQKTLLWSSPAQLRLHVNIGLFQEAYDCNSPCPTQVTFFLFKMMSVHSERMVSEKILQALCDIACTAAYQIVKNGSQKFKVWVPSLADVTLVLMNMGVAFVTLFPFENLQPPFTEGDLLEKVYIKSESPSSNKEQIDFPEHNCNNILKYLSFCMGLCPRAYSDDELLLLLTVVGKVVLDTRLILRSSVDLNPLQYKIVNNIRSWDAMLPRICQALTDLTDDHHNMCFLVNLLPDNTRGKQLRRHLSLSMISKLLDGHCTYRATHKEFQLSELRPYLPRMQPSTLLRDMLSSSDRSQKDKEDDTVTLDQQSYYLCYSLLTLTKEASNFQFFPAHQKEQLLFLLSELETHVKSDIRESEKCLYRSKVKDLVARIDTKWQMLLQKTRPLHNKLHDYWQPVDTLMSNQEEEEDEEDEDEADAPKENYVEMVAEPEEEEKEDKRAETHKDMKPDESPEAMDSVGSTDEASKTEEASDQ